MNEDERTDEKADANKQDPTPEEDVKSTEQHSTPADAVLEIGTVPQDDPTLSRLLNETSCSYVLRQSIIKSVEKHTGRRMIVYTSTPAAPGGLGMIQLSDVHPLMDLLSCIGPDEPIDFMITSPGGLPHVAHKMLLLLRGTKNRPLRFIVPLYAKSAATLMCLGGDKILMSETSELGPIDPQMQKIGPMNEPRYGPAQCFIESFENLVKEVNTKGPSPAGLTLLAAADIAFVELCRKAVKEAKSLAEGLLSQGMMKKDPGRAKEVAEALSHPEGLHGEVINWERAKIEFSLDVDFLPMEDDLWKAYWEIYLRSEIFQRNERKAKVIESAETSIALTS